MSFNFDSRPKSQIKFCDIFSLDFNSYVFVKDFGYFDSRGKLNYSGGVVLKYTLNERISFDAKFLYSTKNFKNKFDFERFRIIQPNDPLVPDRGFEINYSNSYLDVPIDVLYTVNDNDNISAYAIIGLVNSFIISQSNDSQSIFQSDDVYNDYLISSKLGFGLLMKREHIGICLEPQLRIYLNKVHRSFPDSNPVHFGLEVKFLNYNGQLEYQEAIKIYYFHVLKRHGLRSIYS